MTKCQQCAGRSNDAQLCTRCSTALLDALNVLPWWLEALTDTAHGRVRMSDNGGRKSARKKDLDGDMPLGAYIEPLPDNPEHDLDKARRERERLALAHALASGGINARASQLLSEIVDGLGYWVRVVCESRGVEYQPLRFMGRDFIGPLQMWEVRKRRPVVHGGDYVAWLAHHIASIAQFEDAGDIVNDITGWTATIEQVVNRPVRWWSLGECPAEVEAGTCGAKLPRVLEATEHVRCRECKTEHSVSRVLLIRKHEREGTPQTRKQITRYNKQLPPEFQVPDRTLREWLSKGTLTPCTVSEDGDPLYSWIDIRLLMLSSARGSLRRRCE